MLRYTSCMRILALALLPLWMPVVASAAVIYLDPATGEYGPGDTFVMTVRLDTEGECMNAARVVLSYPADTLRAADFGRGGSIFSLWVEEPVLGSGVGGVSFAGGVPGGYCGRIQGDPTESNVLGKIVFTVLRSNALTAGIAVASSSVVYLNDGLGTAAALSFKDASITLASSRVVGDNPWLEEVSQDALPPEPFSIEVQSTEGVFGGRYYAVFSTVDKQSGVDHYEIFERGAWNPVVSPHRLANQSLRGGVQVRAVDKAGNMRNGEYIEGSAPPSVAPRYDLLSLLVFVLVLVLIWGMKRYLDRRPPATPAP